MKTTKPFTCLLIFNLMAIMMSACDNKDEQEGPVSESSLEEQFQAALDHSIATNGGKGISLAIILPDGETLKCVSGISHGSVSITDNLFFSAGSITKMFTAGVLLKYQEEGKLNLDDSLGMWLPSYEHIDGSITLRQLLNHTGGIYDIVENQELWNEIYANPGGTWDLEEVIENYVKAPYFEKGNNWHYSNTGYILLRMIIKEISGNSVGDVYREYLIDPAGLKSTYCVPDESLPDQAAHGWLDVTGDNVYDDLPAESMTSFYSIAGGGIFCTAEDLALWIRELLHEKNVISAASMQEMQEYIFPTPGEDMVERYGLGLLVFNKELTLGMQVSGHGGNPLGYAAGAFYLEDYGVCIGLMDNTEHGVSMPVIADILEIIRKHYGD